ncbi:hypothetical protein C8R44DRAFT_532518, partial [Mycena epipterygia]
RGFKCKELLIRPTQSHGKEQWVPIKPFVSFDFKDWLAGLMARPGNEENMDKSWECMKEPAPMELRDIFDGSLIREFIGPDKKTHFSVPSESGEGRYLFSLNFDGLNPLTLKQAGKKVSVGAFSLVCLNLPIAERYKTENMFLAGIIP